MYRILLVDDEPMVKIGFENLLDWKETTYTIAGTAGNGQEALEFLDANQVDIVITDLKMPVMDGIDLIKALRSREFPGTILVLSSHSDFDLVRSALVAGAQDYLLKVEIDGPGLLAQLDKAAGQLTELRRSQREEEQKQQEERKRERLLRIGSLQEYFRADDGAPGSAPAAFSGGYVLLADFLFADAKGTQAKKNASKRALPLLRSLFPESGNAEILLLTDKELLILTQQGGPEGSLESKALQAIRQVKLYLGMEAYAFLPQLAENLPQARQRYRDCRLAHPAAFYPLPSPIIHPEEVEYGGLPDSLSQALTVETVTEAYLSMAADTLPALLDRQLEQCMQQLTSPGEVIRYFHWLSNRFLSSTADAQYSEELAGLHSALLESRSAIQLRNAFLAFLQRVFDLALLPESINYKKEVRDAMLFIRLHYTEKITLDDISQAVGLNSSYLCRLFKRETGTSLFRYLTALRMEKAASLIDQGNQYIKEVAAAVGIDDQFYFTRLFKRHYGVSPTEYRNSPQLDESAKR